MYMKYFLLIIAFIFHLASAATLHVNVGPHHNYIRMKFNNPQKLDGFLTGLTANGEYQFDPFSVFANYEGYWTTGKFCGNPCQERRVSEHLVYGAFQYRYDFFAIYLGFGYNIFNNTQDPCTADLTYHFKKLIIPLGICFCWDVSPRFAMSIQGEFRPDVYSRIKVIKKNFNSKKKRAFRVQLPLVYSHKRFSLQLIPFFDWNQFGKTTEKLSNGVPFDIPNLTRWYLGMRLLLGYHF